MAAIFKMVARRETNQETEELSKILCQPGTLGSHIKRERTCWLQDYARYECIFCELKYFSSVE